MAKTNVYLSEFEITDPEFKEFFWTVCVQRGDR